MAVVKPKDLKINYEGAWEELRKRVLPELRKYNSFDNIIEAEINRTMDELEKKHKNIITLKRRSDNEIVDYCIKKSVEAQMENIHLKKKLRECQKGARTEHWIQVNPKVKVREKDVKAYIRVGDKKEKISQSMKFLNDIESVLYKKNTTYYGGITHRDFSNTDRYILDRVLELKILVPKEMRVPTNAGYNKSPKEQKLFDIHLVTCTEDALQFTFDWHCTDKKTAYLSNAFRTQEEISWHGLKMRIVHLDISYPGIEGKDKMAFKYEKYNK